MTHTEAAGAIVSARELAMIGTLKAALGHMLNASFDIQQGVPKRTALAALEGGIALVLECLKQMDDPS